MEQYAQIPLDAAFARVFDDLDKAISAGGCTAVVAVKQGSKLHVANAGDARAVLVRKVRSLFVCLFCKTCCPREKPPVFPKTTAQRCRLSASGFEGMAEWFLMAE